MPHLTVGPAAHKGVQPPLAFGSLYVNGRRHQIRPGRRTVELDVPAGESKVLLVFGYASSGVWTGQLRDSDESVLEYWQVDITEMAKGFRLRVLSVGSGTWVNTRSAQRSTSMLRLALTVMFSCAFGLAFAISLKPVWGQLLMVGLPTVALVWAGGVIATHRRGCRLTRVDDPLR